MFTITPLDSFGKNAELRQEKLTGIRCRISPAREERELNNLKALTIADTVHCPFCPENIESDTPCFENGERICIGESTTFPNSFPFGENHIVTVMTKEHFPAHFTNRQISDSLQGQFTGLKANDGYTTINWNCLPSAGASMIHPHLQGLSERIPTYLTSLYIDNSRKYREKEGSNYWLSLAESERESERYLFGDEIPWCASPVPLGEKEIRGYLPFCSFDDFEEYIPEISKGIEKVIRIYKQAGNQAFNMTIRFGKSCDKDYFRGFVSMIARINPNPASISDTAFMERLHLEPVIMTMPESIKSRYRL